MSKMETWTIRTHGDALDFRDALRDRYRRIVLEGGQAMEVRIGVKQQRRTRSQNALQHLWYGEIAAATGHTPEEIKQALKEALLPQVEVVVFGQRRMVPRETSSLTKHEAMDYMDRIQHMAADYGIELTDPGADQWKQWLIEAEEEAHGASRVHGPRAEALPAEDPGA